jgi:hypothetical protein
MAATSPELKASKKPFTRAMPGADQSMGPAAAAVSAPPAAAASPA